ncbi:hypothetical protein [Enterococcus rivorum]|uniref:hypothetical protein n=1 Tax=Enterococcus rivorum TaxID=762845 RepID=UPI003639CCB4
MLKKSKIEDFYMFGVSFEENSQGLSAFEVMTAISIFLNPLMFFYINQQINVIFYSIKPIVYLFYFTSLILHTIFCITLSIRKKTKIKNYELKQGRLFIWGLFNIINLLVLGGYIMNLAGGSNSFFYSNFNERELVLISTILFVLELLTILISSLVIIFSIKKGLYRENQEKVTNMKRTAEIVQLLTPGVTSLSFLLSCFLIVEKMDWDRL